jgi:hypothetical protein
MVPVVVVVVAMEELAERALEPIHGAGEGLLGWCRDEWGGEAHGVEGVREGNTPGVTANKVGPPLKVRLCLIATRGKVVDLTGSRTPRPQKGIDLTRSTVELRVHEMVGATVSNRKSVSVISFDSPKTSRHVERPRLTLQSSAQPRMMRDAPVDGAVAPGTVRKDPQGNL